MDSKRSFTVIDIRKPAQKSMKTKSSGGRFISSSPASAARKAFSSACRAKKIKGQCTLIVTVQETTRGEDARLRSYKLTRTKLQEPRVITRGGGMLGGGTEIVIKYDTTGKAVPVPKM